MKKRSEETQTLRAGCSKAEPKIFAPPQTPFPGARDGQNLISWRWSLLPTNPVWWGSMHAISSYPGNRPTNKQTNPQTNPQKGPITIDCAAASAQCNYTWNNNVAFVADIWHDDRNRLSPCQISATGKLLIVNVKPCQTAEHARRVKRTWQSERCLLHCALSLAAQCIVIAPVCLCVCGFVYVFVERWQGLG